MHAPLLNLSFLPFLSLSTELSQFYNIVLFTEPMVNILIDNYDSFTYNLYSYFCALGADVEVIRNDAITVDGLIALKPERIIISPVNCWA